MDSWRIIKWQRFDYNAIYTGLNDTDGISIFEGDIIQYKQNSSYDGVKFEVKWSENCLGWIFQSANGDVLVNEWTPNGNRFNFLEINGNIFENPELLK